MLHMKLNAAVSVFSIAAAFSVLLPPSNAYGGICFLPDCNLDGTSFDDVNSDSSWCIDNGYYFTCPEGTSPDYSQTCPRDESYTKCSSEQWCIDNGYTKTAQSCYDLGPTWFPQNLCPKGFDLYKSCVEDTAQACEDKGYVNNCSRPDKTEICEWDSSFAKCCNDTESNGCPPRFANGTLLLPNAATIPNQTDVPRTRKSPAVKTARLSGRTPAVMTAINAARPLVRPVTPTPMNKLPAERADISKIWTMKTTTVCTAPAENSINGKKTPAPVMTSVRPMAELITGIIVIRETPKNIQNV